jgi:ADP-ribose pyrophosphatase
MTELLYAGDWLSLRKRGSWEYVSRSRGRAVVAILACTDAQEIILVEQWRAAFAGPCIELPAGLVGDVARYADETLLESARRELHEETGYRARHWHLLYTGASSSGLTDEVVTLYQASGLERHGHGGGDATEDITVHKVPLASIDSWLADRQHDGAHIDIKLWGAIALARSVLR